MNNYDWMGDFGYLEFLRDVGKHFPAQCDAHQGFGQKPPEAVTRLELHRVQLHADQAYDCVHLNDHCGCALQIGGSDQWGNITAGIDLWRRLRGRQLMA